MQNPDTVHPRATTMGTRTLTASEVELWLRSFSYDAIVGLVGNDKYGPLQHFCHCALGVRARKSDTALWITNPDGAYYPIFPDAKLLNFQAAVDALPEGYELTAREAIYLLNLSNSLVP